ncbi:MAG: glycosyl hydrolase [Bacteroidota bacterium]|nr:MAG: glycosyl hydrolase [Bacteroidota bacterium]
MKKVHGLRLVLFLMIAFTSCTQKKMEEKNEPVSVDNQLTPDETTAGWKLLFDGSTLTGWTIFKGRPNNTWEVVNGTLHCKPLNEQTGDGNQRSDLRTTEQYQNFELVFDWKVAPEANSGVMFRVTEEFDQPYYSGPEYQLIDDTGYPGELTEMQKTASNYDMHAAPATKPVKVAGEWNTTKLVVNGNKVEHWLNGDKVVEYELQSADWMQRKEASKWKDAAGYGMAPTGYIDFQDHGNEVWFKNIKIKSL